MKLIDIIAILGALAWLPQIISWIYNWLKKPKISIYRDGEAEVGYIKNGNAFNLRFSFLARDKHALIDDIELIRMEHIIYSNGCGIARHFMSFKDLQVTQLWQNSRTLLLLTHFEMY